MPRNASKLVTIDESVIAISAFDVDGQRKTASKPLVFFVRFQWDDKMYFAEGELGLFATGKTRGDITHDLKASLAMLWLEYVRAPAAELTPDALALRGRLIELFGEDQRAA